MWLSAVLQVDEELPVDRPVARDGTESAQIRSVIDICPVMTVPGEDGAAFDRSVEPVDGADHGMPEAEGGYGELDGHELGVIMLEPVQSGNGGSVGIREDARVRLVVDDGGQVVGDQHELVVPSNLLADLIEAGRPAQVLGDLVVEPQEDGMKLRHDAVLVVARIADERPAIRPAEDLAGIRVERVT